MHVVSVNVGKAQPIANEKPSGLTGIFKQPRLEPVLVSPLGLEGDAIVDTENHGGLDQAVYLYTMPDYEWWSAHLGRPLAPGTFGENLTITDLESATLVIGDRLRVGAMMLEITAPRIPCVTLAVRMEDPQFVKKFRDGEKPGAYCRVIATGQVMVNDPVELIPYQGPRVSVLDLFRSFYQKDLSAAELRRFIAAPIAERDRAYYAQRLALHHGSDAL